MRNKVELLAGTVLMLGTIFGRGVASAPPTSPSVEDFVSAIYGLVSSTGERLPDWEQVRSCFLEEALVVLRTSRSATKSFSRDGFIQDFVQFYERPIQIGGMSLTPKEAGFSEKVLRLRAWEFGDMAHVLVLYEAQITGSPSSPQQGVDSWLLVRRDGLWRVAAVTNEIVTPSRPAPAELGDSTATIGPASPAPQPPQLQDQSQGLETAESLAAVTEEAHYEALYSAAKLHAVLGHRDQAYRFLARAIGAGFNDRYRLLHEDAFQAFREEELFRNLARKAWANGYAGLLERTNREDVQKSPRIMEVLAFRPGERVADIGAGTGYFTIPVAQAVGPDGKVLALDVAPEMLEYLDFRVKALKIENIRLRKVERDDPEIAPGSVDTILLIDTIHYVKDRTSYARRLLPALAPGGRLVVIDYLPKPMSERPWGPPPEQQVSREQMDVELAAAGFEVTRAYDFLPEQYFVVYSPAGGTPRE